MKRRSTQNSIRLGFTLVELMVVIAVIAVLVALVSAAVFKYVNTQARRNTETRISTLDRLLKEHWRKVVEQSQKEPPSLAVVNLASPDAQRNRAKVIWTHVRLLEAFPGSFSEIQSADADLYGGVPPLIPPSRKKYMPTYQQKVGTLTSGIAESSTCLLMALEKSQGGAAVELEGYARDLDGDGLKELIDDFGNPLYFFRFPCNNADLHNSHPAASGTKESQFRNPLDPEGLLTSGTWTNRATFEGLVGYQVFFSGTLPTNYVIPVIVSAGPDGKLGLNSNMQVINSQEAEDNIYSYRLAVGGEP